MMLNINSTELAMAQHASQKDTRKMTVNVSTFIVGHIVRMPIKIFFIPTLSVRCYYILSSGE